MRLVLVVCLAAGVIGCGKNEPAQVPANPVPMQKPGAGAQVGGAKGNAKPSQKPQALQ